MKKPELRTGMVVTLRDGTEYMVMLGMRTAWTGCYDKDLLVSTWMEWCWNSLEYYNEDLTYGGSVEHPENWDIVKVEMYSHPCSIQGKRASEEKRKLLWQREDREEKANE